MLLLLPMPMTAADSHEWEAVPQLSPFPPSDSSPNAMVVFQGISWRLSGWIYKGREWKSVSEIWKSSDCSKWELVNREPAYDPYSAFIVFKDAL